MLTFLIPTAKEMKLPDKTLPHQFSAKSNLIAQTMSNFTIEELAKSYAISETAAQKEFQRWQDIISNSATAYPASFLFNGLMYRNINRELLAQNTNIYITSSFYGIIPALAPIAEHRHDFHTKLTVDGKSLKQFWREDFDTFAQQQKTIVSLLSSEFSDVFSKPVRDTFISPVFMEEKEGQLKTHSTISKKARGAFLSAALKINAKTVSDLKWLTFGDYHYKEKLSNDTTLVFVKQG